MVRRLSDSFKSGTEPATVDVEYTVFETVSVGSDGQFVTGRVYDPSNTTTPQSEYCYHTNEPERSRHITNYLATRDLGEAIVWHSDSPPNLRELGKQHCRFL